MAIAVSIEILMTLHLGCGGHIEWNHIEAQTKWPPVSWQHFQCIYLKANIWNSNTISLKFVAKGPIDNILVLVQKMAWHQRGDKPLSEHKSFIIRRLMSGDTNVVIIYSLKSQFLRNKAQYMCNQHKVKCPPKIQWCNNVSTRFTNQLYTAQRNPYKQQFCRQICVVRCGTWNL